ncbi:MAG: tetraacyldisaccharide 4'-kinase [Tunicatimonas sp.]
MAPPVPLSKALRYLLLPLSAPYRLVTTLRNHLYNIQSKRTLHFTPFIVSVGNLSVGGTGKTPLVVYLAQWLRAHYPLATLSRGYGRQTRGVRIAGAQDTARTLGDEPYLFYRRFGRRATVAVGEERIVAVPEIMHHAPTTQVILLDDAYQHRAIGRDFNILLTSYARPFYRDQVLPAGRLRESRRGAQRADAVVVTKCPDSLSPETRTEMTDHIRRYARPHVPVFFTGIRYAPPLPVAPEEGLPPTLSGGQPVVLFSGLADAAPFDAYARQHFRVVDHITFGDHHRYKDNDRLRLAAALRKAGSSAYLLTTEKDMVKLDDAPWRSLPLYYLPIQPAFLVQEDQFRALLRQRIQAYYGA